MRRQGWQAEVDEYLQEVSQKNFIWGECDCLLFVCDAAKIITGTDPMSYKVEGDPITIRGAYRDEKEARILIRELRRSLWGIMDLHFERVEPAYAQRGDIVLKKLGRGLTFGLVWAGKAFFKTQNEGFHICPVDTVKTAWRVN